MDREDWILHPWMSKRTEELDRSWNKPPPGIVGGLMIVAVLLVIAALGLLTG